MLQRSIRNVYRSLIKKKVIPKYIWPLYQFSLAPRSGREKSSGNEVDNNPTYLFRFHIKQITTTQASTTINAQPRATRAMKTMLNFCWWPLIDVTKMIWVCAVDETILIPVEADDVVSAPFVAFRWTGVLVTRALLTNGLEVGLTSVTIESEKYA